MSSAPYVSHAQNGEDVVLRRALGHVKAGTYVDVGAYEPVRDSVTWGLYSLGWRGVTVEPVPSLAERHRRARPEDKVIEAAVTDDPVDKIVLYAVAGTGLSTTAEQYSHDHPEAHPLVVNAMTLQQIVHDHRPLLNETHLLKVDVEGAEAAVLRSVDLRAWRPWVVVVEATEPNSTHQSHQQWEPQLLATGYRYCLFDGLSRYYVADEHSDLVPALSYPACVLDNYVNWRHQEAMVEAERWRSEAARLQQQVDQLADDLERVRSDVHQLTDALVISRGRLMDRWNRAVHAEVSAAGLQRELDRLRYDHHELAQQSHRLSVEGAQLRHAAETTGARLATADALLASTHEHAAALEETLASMRRTVSWNITSPLRLLRSMVRRGRTQ